MKLLLFLVGLALCYGLPHIYKADEDESTTTLDTDQLKLNFTFTTTNDDQDYIITWTSEIHSDVGAEYILVKLVCDGMVLNEQNWHPNPSGGSGGWAVASGWKYADLTAGDHEFTIWYRSGTAGEAVKIRRSRVMATPANAIIM